MPTHKRIQAKKALKKRPDPAEAGLRAGQDTMARILAKADPKVIVRTYSMSTLFPKGTLLGATFGDG